MAKAKLKATKKTPAKKTKPSKAAMKAAEALVNPPELVLMRQAIEQLGKNTEMLNAMNDTLLDLATKLETQNRLAARAQEPEVRLLTEPAPVPSSPLLADSEEGEETEADADDEEEADEVDDADVEANSDDEEDTDTAARS